MRLHYLKHQKSAVYDRAVTPNICISSFQFPLSPRAGYQQTIWSGTIYSVDLYVLARIT